MILFKLLEFLISFKEHKYEPDKNRLRIMSTFYPEGYYELNKNRNEQRI